MTASSPPQPLVVPQAVAGANEDSLRWAAQIAAGGETPYDSPKITGDIATVEMRPHVPSPATPGYLWFPLEAFSRRGFRDRQVRQIALAVWRASIWNTWRSHYRSYCASAWIAWFFAAWIAMSSGGDRLAGIEAISFLFEMTLLFTPAVAFAALCLAACRTIRQVILSKVFAVLAVAFCGLTLFALSVPVLNSWVS